MDQLSGNDTISGSKGQSESSVLVHPKGDHSNRGLAGHNSSGIHSTGGSHNHGSHNPNAYDPNPANGDNLERIGETIDQNDKINTLTQDVNYLRQIVDFQNAKIDKLTSLITEYFENKNEDAIIRSLQAIQDNVIEDDHVNEIENHVDQQVGVSVHGDLTTQPVHLDGNMDPALHQVAVVAAAVQAQENQSQHSQGGNQSQQQRQQHGDKAVKKIYSTNKRKHDDGVLVQDGRVHHGEGASPYEGRLDAKKPKINVDFLHNPMSVKEIYDEFTKGFRGQIPLRDMDSKYGKHEWRGDSRSKESKRFQRRKKLFDAIERGVLKYGKPAEEIISYIEEFRGEKSLTWVMNGNLPHDLGN